MSPTRNRFYIPYFVLFLLEAPAAGFAQKQSMAGPLGFIENKGQVEDQYGNPNPDVLYVHPGKGMNVQLRKTGYSYDLYTISGLPERKSSGKQGTDPQDLLRTTVSFSRIDIDFTGMEPNVRVRTESPKADHLNYYLGGKKISGVQAYTRVIYENVFPFTDMEFLIAGGEAGSFKYNIILHPGADIRKVKFSVRGADRIIHNENGSLTYSAPVGTIDEWIPYSFYTDQPGNSVPIHFSVSGSEISFEGGYAPTRTLVIDPSSKRIWGTYYGDGGSDYCNAMRCDAQGNVYITGYTLNTTNIATVGTYQSTSGGSFDAYLVKFDGAGNRLWGTYFGGSSVEAAYGMCISAQGNIYICGDTFSTSGVASTGAHQTVYGGGIDDAFLAKFNGSGQLNWATYYGGSLHDIASDVSVDNNANVLMCGHTESSNAIATVSAFQNASAGLFDVFVVKFDSTGVRQWGTYLGDIDMEEAWGVCSDNVNDIYVTGFTSSTNLSTTGSHQQTYGGGLKDAFIAKMNAGGTALNWLTYYGGTGDDAGTGIVFRAPSSLFVSGNATSTGNISSPGAWQLTPGSADDGFLTCFSTGGIRQWGTYYGGNNTDYIEDMVLDGNSNLLVCGSTISTNVMSSTGAWQSANASPGNYDGFFAKFSPGGMRILGSFFGGTQQDNARGIDIDVNGQIYMAGETFSSDSISTTGSFMPVYTASGDAFIAKFCLSPEPAVSPASSLICEGDSIVLSAGNGFSAYAWNTGGTASTYEVPSSTLAGTYYYTVEVTDGYGCTGTSDTATVIVDICDGTSEINDDLLSVFPVPVSDQVMIRFDNDDGKEKTIEVLNASGAVILSVVTDQSQEKISLERFSPGIYFVRVITPEKIYRRKIVRK